MLYHQIVERILTSKKQAWRFSSSKYFKYDEQTDDIYYTRPIHRLNGTYTEEMKWITYAKSPVYVRSDNTIFMNSPYAYADY